MAKGCFRVYQDPQNPRDIHFETAVGGDSPIPEDQMSLRDDVDKSLTTLRMLYPSGDSRFDEYFRQLLSLAQLGLVGDNAQQDVAARALASLKDDITAREGGQIKNRYMRTLGVRALCLGAPAVAGALIVRFVLPDQLTLSNFLFLWGACMAGVWLSFGARRTFVRFENLHILEEDRLEPVVRLMFAGLLTVIMGLLFSTQAVTVQVGAVSTEQISTNVEVALLLGLFCGFSEQGLSANVAKQASSVLDFGRV